MYPKFYLIFSLLCVFSGAAQGEPFHPSFYPAQKIKNPLQLKAAGSVASIATQEGNFALLLDVALLEKPIHFEAAGEEPVHLGIAVRALVPRGKISYMKTHVQLEFPHFIGMQELVESMRRAKVTDELFFIPRNSFVPQDWRTEMPGHSNCTAFRVAADILFTTNECMPDSYYCDLSRVRFNEELDFSATSSDDGTLKLLETYRCTKLIIDDPKLNFSAFQIESVPDEAAHPILKLSMARPAENESVQLVGHPRMFAIPTHSTLKHAMYAKISKSEFAFEPAEISLARCVDLDAFWQENILRSIKSKPDLASKAFVAEGTFTRGIFGCPVLNAEGNSLGMLHALSNLKSGPNAMRRRSTRPLAISSEAQEALEQIPLFSRAYSISNREIYKYHGALLESLGVVFDGRDEI